jgi:hypothetical protein
MIASTLGDFWSSLFSGFLAIVWIVVNVLLVAGLWLTLKKAGRHGWGAIIPIYNVYLIIKMAGRPGWWLILYVIPIVNIIIGLIVAIDVSRNFGHGAGVGILLWLFPWFVYLYLGFGGSQYRPVTH